MTVISWRQDLVRRADRILPAVGRRLLAAPAWLRHAGQPFPPGHYHSPLPDLAELRGRAAQIFAVPTTVPGIDLAAADQLALLPELARLAEDLPYRVDKESGLRYRLSNGWFDHGDGVALFGWLRRLRPRRYVEIGSGWSSALALDVNERFLDRRMRCTFIEPRPERLRSLLRPGDAATVELVATPVHEAPPQVFAELAAGDVLFIDSSHISRVGSDVNQMFLEILPTLPAGVFVHVHDIFYPFEYPRQWIFRGRAWTESYLLRALLIGNRSLRIRWFNSYLGQLHRQPVAEALPVWDRCHGSSIWLETTGGGSGDDRVQGDLDHL